MVYQLILWLVTRAVRASKGTSTHHHHHQQQQQQQHADAPSIHPRIKIEVIDLINEHRNKMTSEDKTRDSRELVKRQPSDHDGCDRVTVRVYDTGDGIPDAEAALRSVAESLALHIPPNPLPAKPQMCEWYIDQDTFELETTCEEEAVIRSYRLGRAPCNTQTVPTLVAGPITIKPASLQFSGTRVSFTVIVSKQRTFLAESIYVQCQTIEKTISSLLGVHGTVTVESVGFRCGEPNIDDSETGRRMLLGKGESSSKDTSSCSVSAVALLSIPDFYGEEERSLSTCESENLKAMPGDPKQVFVYILADCMSNNLDNVDDVIGSTVKNVLLDKIDWDSFGFTLHDLDCPPPLSKVSKAKSGGRAIEHRPTIVKVISLPLRPVQPESQCALEVIAVHISVNNGAKSKKMRSLVPLIKNAINGALTDVKRSCPTAAMASGRERSIARAVPILSRSLLTSILGGSATTFKSEEEFQSRIFEVLSVALSDK